MDHAPIHKVVEMSSSHESTEQAMRATAKSEWKVLLRVPHLVVVPPEDSVAPPAADESGGPGPISQAAGATADGQGLATERC